MLVIVGAAAALAAGGTVALAVITPPTRAAAERLRQPLAGAPPLVLDLGVRVDPEARALRRAERLYSQKRRAAAGRIFARYDSPAARIGAAFAGLAGLEPGEARAAGPRAAARLARAPPPRVREPLGRASPTRRPRRGGGPPRPSPTPPRPSGRTTALHPNFPPGQPFFVPSFRPPPGLDRPRAAGPAGGARARRTRGATPTRSFSTGSRSSGSATGSPPGGSTTRPPGSLRVTPRRASPRRSPASTRAGRRRRSPVSARSRGASRGPRRCAFTSGSCSSGWPEPARLGRARASASCGSRQAEDRALRWRGKQSASWPV